MGNIETCQAGDCPWVTERGRVCLCYHGDGMLWWRWEANTAFLLCVWWLTVISYLHWISLQTLLRLWRFGGDVCFIWGNLKVSHTFRCPWNLPVWFWMFQWMNGRACWSGNTNTHTASFLISLSQRSSSDLQGLVNSWGCPPIGFVRAVLGFFGGHLFTKFQYFLRYILMR